MNLLLNHDPFIYLFLVFPFFFLKKKERKQSFYLTLSLPLLSLFFSSSLPRLKLSSSLPHLKFIHHTHREQNVMLLQRFPTGKTANGDFSRKQQQIPMPVASLRRFDQKAKIAADEFLGSKDSQCTLSPCMEQLFFVF